MTPTPSEPGVQSWWVNALYAVGGLVVGLATPWCQATFDMNRKRERVRQVVLEEVNLLRTPLDGITFLADVWQLPSGDHYWSRVDNAMMGFNALHIDLALLPSGLGARTRGWFLEVKALRMGAQFVASDWRRDHQDVVSNTAEAREFERKFDAIRDRAAALALGGKDVYTSLYDAVPLNPLRRIGAGISQRYRSLAEAEKAGGSETVE